MSAIASAGRPPQRASVSRVLDDLLRHDPILAPLGLVMIALMAPTLFAMAVDERSYLGVDVWVKPLKFEFSLAVYLLTLGVFARYLPEGFVATRRYRLFAGSVVIAVIAEMAWILAAATMGTSSHFNPTPLGRVIFPIMGLAAILLTSATSVYAWQIARNPNAGLSAAMRESIVVGLALVLPLTLITAGTMSSLGSHRVGELASDAGGLAILGWARDAGDLRVSHFFATHAMHIVPAFGLVSVAMFGGEERRPLRAVTLLFVLLVIVTYVQALGGLPFLAWLG